MNKFKGMGVAMITPFTANKEIDIQALKKHTEFLIENGTNYLVALGTTAETPTLSSEEKQLVLKTIGEQNQGRIPLVVGFGGNNTLQMLEELKKQDFTHVDAILTASPYYNKPSQEGLLQHYQLVADASPRPMILYNIPGRTGVNMSVATIAELAKHPNIIGVKEAAGSIEQMGAIIQATPEDFLVISGDDALTLPMVALGGAGVISVLGNAFPKEWTELVQYALKNDFTQARSIHYRFLNSIDYLFRDGNPAGIKALLHHMGHIENQLRLPLVPAQQSTVDKLIASL